MKLIHLIQILIKKIQIKYEDFKIKYNNKKENEIFQNIINQSIKINPLNEKQNFIILSDSKNLNGKKYEKNYNSNKRRKWKCN